MIKNCEALENASDKDTKVAIYRILINQMTLERSMGIVVPTLNSKKYLKETAESLVKLKILFQKKVLDLQLIVVDSGSNDGTLDICKNYGFDVLYFPPGNMYKAVNFGFKHLNSNWLGYCNSDDVIYPENFLKAFLDNENNNSDLICGGTDYIDGDSNYLYSRRMTFAFLNRKALLYGLNFISQPSTFFSRKLYESLNGFSENYLYSSDFDFYVRTSKENFSIERVNYPLSQFRVHKDQFSIKKINEMRSERISIIESNKLKTNKFLKTLISSLNQLHNIDNHYFQYKSTRKEKINFK